MKLNFLRILSNLNFAIILLLIIATFSVIGTIIEQDQTFDYYIQNYSTNLFLTSLTLSTLILIFGIG